MNVYILTSDKSIHIIKGLQYCINKYWKPNPYITVLGYKKPSFKLDNNFSVTLLKSTSNKLCLAACIKKFTLLVSPSVKVI